MPVATMVAAIKSGFCGVDQLTDEGVFDQEMCLM